MIELMRALSGVSTNWQLWAGRNANILLQEAASTAVADRINQTPVTRTPGRLIGTLRNEPAFASWTRAAGIKLVHRTYYPMVDMIGHRLPHVETLHDMWDERANRARDRGAALRSRLKRNALERADVIICVSESTRQEMASLWPHLQNKAVVIHHGVRPLARHPILPERSRPYFLFVGRRDHYKNFALTLKALHLSSLPDYDLLCFGGGPLEIEERRLIVELNLSGRVSQVGGNDAHLAGYYEAAAGLLYPSRYEGFGLPLLEAMIHRCPVITTACTSLPEVGGEAALYASPDDPRAWADLMARVAGSEAVSLDLRARGIHRAAEFSWLKTADAHSAIYSRLC